MLVMSPDDMYNYGFAKCSSLCSGWVSPEYIVKPSEMKNIFLDFYCSATTTHHHNTCKVGPGGGEEDEEP